MTNVAGIANVENVFTIASAGFLNPLTIVDLIDDFDSGGSVAAQVGRTGFNFSGGTLTVLGAEASHPGIVRRDTSATISTLAYAQARSTVANGTIVAGELFDLTVIFRLNTNDADTRMRIGISVNWSTDPATAGVYLEKTLTDTEWFGVCRSSSAETRTAALASVDTSWHKIRMRRIDAGTIGFTLDAGSEVTVTANIPTSGVQMQPGWSIFNGAAVSKTIDVDFVWFRVTGIVR